MAVRRPKIRRTRSLVVLRMEHDEIVGVLQRRIDALEEECEQLRAGFETLTRALRRQGCCDATDNGHAPH